MSLFPQKKVEYPFHERIVQNGFHAQALQAWIVCFRVVCFCNFLIHYIYDVQDYKFLLKCLN